MLAQVVTFGDEADPSISNTDENISLTNTDQGNGTGPRKLFARRDFDWSSGRAAESAEALPTHLLNDPQKTTNDGKGDGHANQEFDG